jgi:prepilin-type N-terminal cleavage/methylation domain-containing protein
MLRNVTWGGVNPARRNAFTLAEVLITLGIIGVVSALTLPSVITNYKKQQTVNQLKATYSIISQAVKASEVDNGTLDTWDIPDVAQNSFGVSTYDSGKEFSEKYLLPYLKIVRTCKYRTTECFPDSAYYLDGKSDSYFRGNSNATYNFVLSNGTVVGVWPRGKVAEIYIDINGKKNPNKLGIDEFVLVLVKSEISSTNFGINNKAGLYFYGSGLNRNVLKTSTCCQCAKSGTQSGLHCGALIMLDGWKIADDYPW